MQCHATLVPWTSIDNVDFVFCICHLETHMFSPFLFFLIWNPFYWGTVPDTSTMYSFAFFSLIFLYMFLNLLYSCNPSKKNREVMQVKSYSVNCKPVLFVSWIFYKMDDYIFARWYIASWGIRISKRAWC